MSKNNSPLVSLHAPWDHNQNAIWLASTLRLMRNIDKFKFPHKLDAERKKHILHLASKAVLQSPELKNPYILPAEEMTPAEKEFLIEHFLLFEGLQEAAKGAAFALDASGEMIVLFNIKEHIQIQCTDTTGDLERSWSKICAIENELSKDVNFAFSEKFGFLTADPLHSGCALLASSYLHLPALIHQHTLLDLVEKERMEGITATGLQGSPDDLVGDILMLRNVYTLGVNEETILSTLRSAILRLVVAEKDARSAIKSSQDERFKDQIFRAIGLVKYSYKLDAQEALNALSLLKLGIELGWLKGVTVETINKLFFDSRRSHLTYLLSEITPGADIGVKRAELLRSQTEGLSLVL